MAMVGMLAWRDSPRRPSRSWRCSAGASEAHLVFIHHVPWEMPKGAPYHTMPRPLTTHTYTYSSVLVRDIADTTADPGAFLREALEATFSRAVGLWAAHTVRPLGE